MTQNEQGTATPAVSIGMPVYNGEKYIREALDSVLAQTYQAFELIISDNASNDRTQEICMEYAKRDARIRYVRQSSNLGGHWNFNFVAREAKGSLFTWLAHDDILMPHFLEEAVQFMSRRPKAVLVAGDFKVIDEDGAELGTEKLERIRDHIQWNKRCVEFFKYPISNVFFCIYGVMKSEICRSVFLAIKEPKIAAGSELPILARFAAAGEIASIPVILRKYRRHAASMYVRELAEISKRSIFHRFRIRIGKSYRLRFDQWAVLLSSALSPSLKCAIAFKVLFYYMRRLLRRILRISLIKKGIRRLINSVG